MSRLPEKKKIGIDVRMIKSSGIGRVIENILKRIIPRNTEWKFILLGRKYELLSYGFSQFGNVMIIDCNSPIYSCSEQIELYRKIPKGIDLFWSPHYNIPLFYRGKLIVTVHDVFHLAMLHGIKNIHKRFYAKMLFYSLSKKADKIICVSHFTANELMKYVNINEKKVSVIYNGIDEKWFHIKKQKKPHIKKYILYIGNIKPHKNLVRLLKAFQMLQEQIPHDLILVGKKEGFITGDNQIERLKINKERVFFTGYVSEETLEQYLVYADLMVFPSLYEGFGLPPLEAMACGCPVATSNAAAIPEICEDYVTYFDPYDINDIAEKILLISNNPIEDRKSPKGMTKFNWDKEIIKYENIIKNVI